ncbi:probable aspartic proteinase GIP2 [Humulus lupulus]|uniref:probable aspartic proteinase GIP2 n=1 Tax=Humulus lupulus TaxID=3486 RepID=UPI002B40B75E|nr:probable aspartic proteinase GIP2 [Humulus lupulus]
MASSFSFKLFFFLFLFSALSSHLATAKTAAFPKALVLPVTKDTTTRQYITQITQRTPPVQLKVVLDVGGEFLWIDCEKGYKSSTKRHVPCGSPQCVLSGSGACTTSDNPSDVGVCGVMPNNPFSSVGTSGDLFEDILYIQSTNGFNPGKQVSVPNLLFSCAPNSLLEGLASGIVGMAGFGRNKVALPSLFSSAFSFPRKFGVCLSSSNGVIFFGKEPYVLLPGIDVSDPTSLTYTPLIQNPRSLVSSFEGNPSAEYFIGVKSIKVDGKPLRLNTTLLTFDNEGGHGGTKISTVDPFTTLETSIYKAVVGAFVKALGPKVPRVKAVAPFGACFNAKYIGNTRVGPAVPQIDLVLRNDKLWSIFGANSMVSVGDDVLCLGFVDGGPLNFVDWGVKFTPTAVVIGGHQIENNFLLFDLGASRLGFSSSLLFRQTTCSNFNFNSSTY